MATFQEKLDKVRKGENLSAASLTFLSDLSSEDRATLRSVWPELPRQARKKIVAELVTLAEDNIEFHFRHVFLTALEDSDPDVRLSAIEGLYEDESKLLLGRLIPMLRTDPEPAVREAVAKALGRFTFLAHCAKLTDQGTLLRATLLESAEDEDEDEDVRRRSVEALGYFHGDKEVQDLIAETYQQGGTAAESAIFAMGRSMEERWQQTVLDELKSETAAMRFEAARAAGEMELEDALTDLVGMVEEDSDSEVRLAAVWALGQIGGKAAAKAITRLLKSQDPAIREAAQEALQEALFAVDPLTIPGATSTPTIQAPSNN
ncbi:MAG TPA: HEAT repeat domain-containing protein [Chloroflexia bacterium]|nr:HEAT repeat domain-containing protein [Chloroflexia bacterium]